MPSVRRFLIGALTCFLPVVVVAGNIQVLPSASPGSPPEVYLSGEITSSTVAEFSQISKRKGLTGAIVYLDSAGGDPHAGIALGELIRAAQMNTAIGRPGASPGHPLKGSCMSACVLTYAGGTFRFIDPASTLGIHRFYRRTATTADLDVAQVVSAAITSYLIKMGVSPSLFERMALVARGKMAVLSHADAAQLNLVNNGVLPASWAIEGKQGTVYLVGRQRTWNGSGKLVMTCAPGRRVKLSALYEAGGNNDYIVKHSTHFSLRINQQFLPISSLQGQPSLSGEYILASFLPDDTMLNSLAGAERIGFGFHTRDADTFFGFLVDAAGAQEMVRSWIKHCTER
ncbi:COG3904 family protein [Pseudomonas guariconensis]|uniref:COG3904 family protein n=1 Tax=Pseudomonas guariconensis TaxID=1288410 RepID=UPI003906895D